jgi:outer membrane lipoprotein SlyB
MKFFRRPAFFLLMLVAGFLPAGAALAQTGPAVIRSLSVDQVAQLSPGTELIFRAAGSAGGQLVLDIDGLSNQLGLAEVSPGSYAGAYTISIRDKIPFDAKVRATLKVGTAQVSAMLGQTLLTPAEHARMVAATTPVPVALQISRIETRTTGAYSGGHELSFIVDGTPGGTAQVSLDGGRSQIALAEERSGRYAGRYTVKTSDQFSATTPVVVTLALADKTVRAAKDLAPGATAQTAQAAPPAPAPACEACGVVVSVNKVKVKGQSNYIGAIAGGVGGAALGNQVGKGDGKKVATILGAVGGAFAGREIEKQVNSGYRYDVVVRLDNGSSRTLSYASDPGLASGAKVQVVGDALQLRP